MAKRGQTQKRERMNLDLTPEQSDKFNNYIIRLGQKQGRIPSAIKTKILRAALDEWFKKHIDDLDIDWKNR